MTSNNVNKEMEVLLCAIASDVSNQWEPIGKNDEDYLIFWTSGG